jgi:hypothetical protein
MVAGELHRRTRRQGVAYWLRRWRQTGQPAFRSARLGCKYYRRLGRPNPARTDATPAPLHRTLSVDTRITGDLKACLYPPVSLS